MNDVKIKKTDIIDFEWANANKFNINFDKSIVGEMILWTFNKESIIENIEDDYAYYMDEDTHMYERTANFILDNMKDKDCVYIESLFIYEKYRGKGIGTKALEFVKENYKDTYIVLLASALDIKDKIAFMTNDEGCVENILERLDTFYKRAGFKSKDNIYYID